MLVLRVGAERIEDAAERRRGPEEAGSACGQGHGPESAHRDAGDSATVAADLQHSRYEPCQAASSVVMSQVDDRTPMPSMDSLSALNVALPARRGSSTRMVVAKPPRTGGRA